MISESMSAGPCHTRVLVDLSTSGLSNDPYPPGHAIFALAWDSNNNNDVQLCHCILRVSGGPRKAWLYLTVKAIYQAVLRLLCDKLVKILSTMFWGKLYFWTICVFFLTRSTVVSQTCSEGELRVVSSAMLNCYTYMRPTYTEANMHAQQQLLSSLFTVRFSLHMDDISSIIWWSVKSIVIQALIL